MGPGVILLRSVSTKSKLLPLYRASSLTFVPNVHDCLFMLFQGVTLFHSVFGFRVWDQPYTPQSCLLTTASLSIYLTLDNILDANERIGSPNVIAYVMLPM
jgi:hypothetical protein